MPQTLVRCDPRTILGYFKTTYQHTAAFTRQQIRLEFRSCIYAASGGSRVSVISVHVLYIQYTDVTTTWTTVMKLTNKSPAPTSSALLAPKFVLRVHLAGASDTHSIVETLAISDNKN